MMSGTVTDSASASAHVAPWWATSTPCSRRTALIRTRNPGASSQTMAVVPPLTARTGSSRDTPLQLAREAFGALLVENHHHLVRRRLDAALVISDLTGLDLVPLALEQLEEAGDDRQRRAEVVDQCPQSLFGV